MYFTNFKDGLIQLMKEINKIRIEKIRVEHKNIKTAFNEVAAQEASLEEGEVSSNKEALDNLKQRQDKLAAEHQRIRIANEDYETLYKVMLEEVIEIQDASKYRLKIKGFKEAFGGVKDMKERLHGLINVNEIQPKLLQSKQKASDEENYAFKPFLYKDPYKGKVQSIIKTQIDQSSKL